MNKLKVATIVGTRPEIIRLSRVINILDLYCDHLLIHTGQNYDFELNEIFFNDLKITKPDYYLDAVSDTASSTIGKIITLTENILIKEKPDAILILGDTNSCLSAIAAKRLKIPIFHMEAGNRCFDQRVPEEINRKIVDHISDVNLTYSDISREYLINEGLPPELIIKTGSPMFEVLEYYKDKIESSPILSELELLSKNYFVVSAHREENIDNPDNFLNLHKILNIVAKQFSMPIIFSAHPRTRKMIKKLNLNFDEKVRIIKPLSFTSYVKLQKESKVVLSDSGTITEESSILNFPALNIRQAHERPEGMEEGSVMMVGLNYERVMQGISILEDQKGGKSRSLKIVSDYDKGNVSQKVVRVIHSYTDYINRTVWKKFD